MSIYREIMNLLVIGSLIALAFFCGFYKGKSEQILKNIVLTAETTASVDPATGAINNYAKPIGAR